MILLNLPSITTALATVATPPTFLPGSPRNAILQANFAWGSGGTTFDAYVQSSVDNGLTWFDVANFHFTTAIAIRLFNLSALTPVTTIYTPTDGSLGANTAKDGLLGPAWRVKYGSTGTYANTSLVLAMITDSTPY